MSPGLKPYPAYKDSGLPWTPKLPAHWSVRRGKALFLPTNYPVRELDEIVTCFRDGQVTLRRNRRETGFMVALKEAGYQGVRKGQLVIHAMDAFAGAVGVSDSNGKCTPEYIVCEPRDSRTVQWYFVHALRLAAQMKSIEVECSAVRERAPRLRYPNFASMGLPVPSFAEQSAIVRYLEYMDRRMRRYLRIKKQSIALLEEQKRSIISQAVRGIVDVRSGNPYAAYFDSGIGWLGQVPDHWRISRIKNEFVCLDRHRVPISGVERGSMTRRAYDYYGASGVIDRVDDYLFDDELVLVAEDGANLVLRNLPLAVIARGKFWVNNHAHILKPRLGNLEYLAAVLESLDYRPWISGAAQPKLTQDRLMSITIALPDREEQDAILERLSSMTRELDRAIEHGRSEIALLFEYRTRLVADVVTGKVDVRDAASALLDKSGGSVPPISDDPADISDDVGMADGAALEEARYDN